MKYLTQPKVSFRNPVWLSVAWDGHCIFMYTCIIYSQGLSGVIYVCSLPNLSLSVITAFISSNGIAVD